MPITIRGRHRCKACNKSHTIVHRKLADMSGKWFFCEKRNQTFKIDSLNKEHLVMEYCSDAKCGYTEPWKGSTTLRCPKCHKDTRLEVK